MQPEATTKSSNTGKIVGIAVVAIVVVAVLAFVITGKKSDNKSVESANTTSNANSQTAQNNTSTTDTAVTFKDGTYDAVGNYQSPGGDESINVHLTLKDGTITDVSVVGNGVSSNAKTYQGKFIGAVQSVVVGKKINGLKLSRTAGSSLTPMGFNDAISKIESQAKS